MLQGPRVKSPLLMLRASYKASSCKANAFCDDEIYRAFEGIIAHRSCLKILFLIDFGPLPTRTHLFSDSVPSYNQTITIGISKIAIEPNLTEAKNRSDRPSACDFYRRTSFPTTQRKNKRAPAAHKQAATSVDSVTIGSF